MTSIQLDPKHRQIVTSILERYPGIEVYAFGSRTKGQAKRLSDLDLAVKSKITKITLEKIRGDFEESDLPFHVDIILWKDLSVSFKSEIEKDLVLIKTT